MSPSGLSTRKRLLALIGVVALSAASFTCSPAYVLRAGMEEARILSRRRPIAEVAADPATAAEERRKLDLVLQARTFSDEYLGLDAGESYTTYSWVDSDTLLMVVSGAEKDRFRQVTWWFPIVGRVPYKGYFEFAQADAEVARLEREGYDAHVRPAAAFSTLGWFNDPVLNTVLRSGDVSLVGTVIHEITHNTLYLPSQAAFNESFANFVGDVGAAEYWCGVEGEEGQRCRTARQVWRDNVRFGGFLSRLVERLEELYGREDLSREAKIERREDVFAEGRRRFEEVVEPGLEVLSFRGFVMGPLNNATLIGRRLYYQRLELFEDVYDAYGRDLRRALPALLEAAAGRPDDPYGAVEALLTEARPR